MTPATSAVERKAHGSLPLASVLAPAFAGGFAAAVDCGLGATLAPAFVACALADADAALPVLLFDEATPLQLIANATKSTTGTLE
jgi:hypothetical protein